MARNAWEQGKTICDIKVIHNMLQEDLERVINKVNQ